MAPPVRWKRLEKPETGARSGVWWRMTKSLGPTTGCLRVCTTEHPPRDLCPQILGVCVSRTPPHVWAPVFWVSVGPTTSLKMTSIFCFQNNALRQCCLGLGYFACFSIEVCSGVNLGRGVLMWILNLGQWLYFCLVVPYCLNVNVEFPSLLVISQGCNRVSMIMGGRSNPGRPGFEEDTDIRGLVSHSR